MLCKRLLYGFVELYDLAVAELREPLGLPSGFASISVLYEAFNAGIGAQTLPVENVRCRTRFE